MRLSPDAPIGRPPFQLEEQIALVVTDYDAANGVLSITKARVSGIDRDRTKIAEDRRVVLNARARS